MTDAEIEAEIAKMSDRPLPRERARRLYGRVLDMVHGMEDAAIRAAFVDRMMTVRDRRPVTPATLDGWLIAEGVNPLTVFNHFETDGGDEVERDDEFAPDWITDAHAVLLHRVHCGCLCPENKDRPDFYGGRTQMPFPTFSATQGDLG